MKKLRIVVGVIIVIVLIWVANTINTTINTTKIIFDEGLDKDSIGRIEISTPGAKGLYTKDRSKILKGIDVINSMRFSKQSNLTLPNSDPDAWVAIYDKNDNIINKIEFYGDKAVYKEDRYEVYSSIYDKLESLCNK